MEWTDNTPEVKISKVLLNKQVYNILFDWIVEDPSQAWNQAERCKAE